MSSIASLKRRVSSLTTGVYDDDRAKKGLGTWMTGGFVFAQMAGAGFLALPDAVKNTGWIGIPMMILFCCLVGFSGTRLGMCWVMLEERWPHLYLAATRSPYMDIAERALGKHGRRTAYSCVLITLFGASTVAILVLAQLTTALVVQLGTDMSICEWLVIYAAILLPCTWLGTPKDFWQSTLLAVVATVITCVVVIVELFFVDVDTSFVQFPNPTVASFSLAFGAILFSFGGASTFPTIQNDMKDRSQFWKSIIIGFTGLLALYLPVAGTGYGLLGSTVPSNILLAVNPNIVVLIAFILELINLLATYIITFNPIAQVFEHLLNVPPTFGIKRVLVRSAVVVVELIICLAVPDFGLVVNLAGGSTITICTFILPPIMYMTLVKNCDDPEWPQRTIPTWERIMLWEIVCLGVIGGICATASALFAIFGLDALSSSCLVDFYQLTA